MNELMNNNEIDIKQLIYVIDGKEVMLDSDLANLYNVETYRINEAVKNNPDKFPSRYVFRIDDKTYNALISNFSISKGGSRKGHNVFTEQGIYMLATILKSKEATQVSIRIMDTFVRMRHYINFNKEVLPRKFMLLEHQVDENTKKIDELFDKFDPKEIINCAILFGNQIYDAYSIVMDIFNSAIKELIIIDNYAGKELLDMVKNIDINIIIVSKNIDKTLKKKYESQYHNVTFIQNDSFHDRFIIVDRLHLYLCGASFKDVGKLCFGIYENMDFEYLNRIVETINI